MNVYEQEAPNAIQVELTEGCNLRCSFCGLNGIRGEEANFKFMTVQLAEQLARSIADAGWTSRIEFAMHGEPTLNKDAAAIVQVFREYLPRASIMMTSNGGGLLRGGAAKVRDNVHALFFAGLNVLALDDYEYAQLVPKVLEAYNQPHLEPDSPEHGWYPVHHYPANPQANPHKRHKPGEHFIVVIRDISLPDTTTGTHAVLNNHAGAAAPPSEAAMGKRCAKPFRELSVRWDGNVAVCCNDWRGEYKVGNVAQLGVLGVWHSLAMDAARRKLYHGQRDFGPCLGCDALSYRPGLLPDRMGKDSLPVADAEAKRAIQQALAGPSYTQAVQRPWEVDSTGTPVPKFIQLRNGRGPEGG